MKLEYAVVFSGGGALGAWEFGCYKTILSHNKGIKPTVITGASAGAINAAAICAGLEPEELRNLWECLTRDSVYIRAPENKTRSLVSRFLRGLVGKRSVLGGFAALAKKTHSLYDTRPLYSTLEKILSPRWNQFISSPISFAISLSDLKAMKRYYYFKAVSGFKPPSSDWIEVRDLASLMAALMGTSAIPLLFPPHDGLFDGGVLRNQPLGAAVALGAKKILLIMPTPTVSEQPKNLAEIGAALLRTWMSAPLLAQRALLDVENKINDYLKEPRIKVKFICPPEDLTKIYGVGLLSFGVRVSELINAGEKAALVVFQECEDSNGCIAI